MIVFFLVQAIYHVQVDLQRQQIYANSTNHTFLSFDFEISADFHAPR